MVSNPFDPSEQYPISLQCSQTPIKELYNLYHNYLFIYFTANFGFVYLEKYPNNQ